MADWKSYLVVLKIETVVLEDNEAIVGVVAQLFGGC